jgi:hypothetical protein
MSAAVASPRTDWAPIVERAAEIVRSYDTSVTLRQLYYRLVSEQLIPNITSAYKSLSSKTAEARRSGWFPSLIDPGREIDRYYPTFTNPGEAREWIKSRYRRDRTEGQAYAIYLGVEKAGMVEQLRAWFGAPLGVPILALGGYSSQSYVDEIVKDVSGDGRRSVLIYAGDLDASGEDIDRDFTERADCWDAIRRVALLPVHVDEFNLPALPGKPSDSRAGSFIDRHGSLFQIELDALPPDELRRLFADELARWWDVSVHRAVLAQEDIDRMELE